MWKWELATQQRKDREWDWIPIPTCFLLVTQMQSGYVLYPSPLFFSRLYLPKIGRERFSAPSQLINLTRFHLDSSLLCERILKLAQPTHRSPWRSLNQTVL